MTEQAEQHWEDQADHERRKAGRGKVFDVIEQHVHRQGITHPDLVEGIMEQVMDVLDNLTMPTWQRRYRERV